MSRHERVVWMPKIEFESVYIVRVDTWLVLFLEDNDRVRAAVQEPLSAVRRI